MRPTIKLWPKSQNDENSLELMIRAEFIIWDLRGHQAKHLSLISTHFEIISLLMIFPHFHQSSSFWDGGNHMTVSQNMKESCNGAREHFKIFLRHRIWMGYCRMIYDNLSSKCGSVKDFSNLIICIGDSSICCLLDFK